MSCEQAIEIETLFEVLANDTRLRMLHLIVKEGEAWTTDLAAGLEMKPQAVSNQLRRLQDRGIVAGRRSGNNVFYRLVVILLERALCLIEESNERSRIHNLERNGHEST